MTLLECDDAVQHVTLFPIRDDGSLIDKPLPGKIIAQSAGEFKIEVSRESDLSRSTLLVGVKQCDGQMAYLGIEITRSSFGLNSQVIEAVRGGIGERLLAEEGRMPVLNEQCHRFEREFSDEVYLSWKQAGILKYVALDKVLVCPNCSALPTFRFGCKRCNSGRLIQAVLIHHFACACVAPLEAFETAASMKCPKCQTKHLIAGTDFEYAPGEHHCQDCGWKTRELVQVGHCLECESRFSIHQAVEQELGGYHVNRLDEVALKSFQH